MWPTVTVLDSHASHLLFAAHPLLRRSPMPVHTQRCASFLAFAQCPPHSPSRLPRQALCVCVCVGGCVCVCVHIILPSQHSPLRPLHYSME